MERLAASESAQKVRQRGDERVLVADDVSRLPEISGVRLVRPRHKQPARALQIARIAGVEKFQPVQVFQIEPRHALRAVNLESVAILASHGIACGLEAPETAVRKARQG